MAKERKGLKLRRITNASKAYYKLQFGKTDDNRRKRIMRHLKWHPTDASALKDYERVSGGRVFDTSEFIGRYDEARARRAFGKRVRKAKRAKTKPPRAVRDKMDEAPVYIPPPLINHIMDGDV